ncbi:MAG: hypothetical protein U1E91_05210 [Moraxella sp.]
MIGKTGIEKYYESLLLGKPVINQLKPMLTSDKPIKNSIPNRPFPAMIFI